MEEKTCDKYCHDCFFYGGQSEPALTCNYLLMRGKRRPCPPGKGCTVKERRGKKRRTQKDNREERKIQNAVCTTNPK